MLLNLVHLAYFVTSNIYPVHYKYLNGAGISHCPEYLSQLGDEMTSRTYAPYIPTTTLLIASMPTNLVVV